MKYRVFLAGGGTGGHVYPNLAFLSYLKKSIDIQRVYYLGLRNKPEEKIIGKEEYKEYKFLPIRSYQFPRSKNLIIWILFFIVLLIGILKSMACILRYRPHIVISSGGYVSVPVLISSYIYKILCHVFFALPPVIISIEPNIDPGLANSTFGLLSDKVFVSFRETQKIYRDKAQYVGYPVRSDLRNIRILSKSEKDEIKERLKIPKDRKIILITGGSQGAKNINTLISSLIPELKKHRDKLFIIHSTGLYSDNEYDAYEYTVNNIRKVGSDLDEIKDFYECHSFLYNIIDYISICDLAIIRGGAGSVFEMLQAGKPSILIPKTDIAGDHQLKNCREVSKKGFGMILYEYKEIDHKNKPYITIDKERFMSMINDFLENGESFKKIKENLSEYSPPHTETLATRSFTREIKKNRERYEKNKLSNLSIINKCFLAICFIIFIFLFIRQVPSFASLPIVFAILLYLCLYGLRRNYFIIDNIRENISHFSYFLFTFMVSSLMFLFFMKITDDWLSAALLIPLIAVNNILRKLLERHENSYDLISLMLFLIFSQFLFYKFFLEEYFYYQLYFYFTIINIYLLFLFIKNGIKKEKLIRRYDDLIFMIETILIFLFIINSLYFIYNMNISAYYSLIVSSLVLVPIINIALMMVRKRFIDQPSHPDYLSIFTRGIIFYTLPIIIIFLFLEKEFYFFINWILPTDISAYSILPAFFVLSPLLLLIPLSYIHIRVQKFNDQRQYLWILVIILLFDFFLKLNFQLQLRTLSLLFSFYIILFLMTLLIAGKVKNKVKSREIPKNLDNINLIESGKLFILFALFILTIVNFKFNEIRSILALVFPLFSSITIFLVLSHVLSIRDQFNISNDKGSDDILISDKNAIENYPALRFSQLLFDELMKLDKDFLLLRLSTFKYSGSWWFINCGIKLIGNMKKDDELDYLISIIKERKKNINPLIKLIAGDYKYNAIMRRNAIESIIKIGKWNDSLKKAMLTAMNDKHFEVRTYALICLKKFKN